MVFYRSNAACRAVALAKAGARPIGAYLVTRPSKLPAGIIYDHPVSSLDVGATAVALAGLEKPATLEGTNLIPHLRGKVESPPHDMLFWRFWNQAAVRKGKGKWKHYRTGDVEYLFDLESPEHENLNRIKEHPEIAKELHAALEKWCAGMKNPGLPKGPPQGGEKAWFDHYLPK